MTTNAQKEPSRLSTDIEQLIEQRVEAVVNERLEKLVNERIARAMKRDPARRKVAIIASKGTLDMAYPPLILATTAAAMDAEVHVFFTFYGLNILKKHSAEKLQIAPIANPAMPIPNILGMLPGMTPMATKMMKGMFSKHNVVSISELLRQALELNVKLIGCQMTMDVMGIRREDLLDEIEIGGAATFLGFANGAHTTLFI
ncbi:MAG: hypothetical protein NVSMB38_20030 [Ktedonobacteraceae bacterium]